MFEKDSTETKQMSTFFQLTDSAQRLEVASAFQLVVLLHIPRSKSISLQEVDYRFLRKVHWMQLFSIDNCVQPLLLFMSNIGLQTRTIWSWYGRQIRNAFLSSIKQKFISRIGFTQVADAEKIFQKWKNLWKTAFPSFYWQNLVLAQFDFWRCVRQVPSLHIFATKFWCVWTIPNYVKSTYCRTRIQT